MREGPIPHTVVVWASLGFEEVQFVAASQRDKRKTLAATRDRGQRERKARGPKPCGVAADGLGFSTTTLYEY